MSYSSLGAPSSPAVNNTTTSTGTRTLSRGTTSKPKPSPLRKRKISINTMEVDKPTAPTVFDSAHDENKRSDAIEGVFDLNEFLATQVLLREENNENTAPASKKVKQKNASNANNTNATSLTPVAVGARSSKHTILLHEKYQALGIPQPMFSYEGGSETGWTVSVSFPGLKDVELADVDELQGLKMQGETEKNKRFNSKQEAKEALSKRALEVLEELENEGRIRKSEKARKQNVSGKGVQQQLKEEKEPGENYIGQLLEFQRSTGAPQPTYTDYQSGTRFACLVTIDDTDAQFGSLESLHSSKKAARQESAGRAVAHFKALGVWPEDVTPVGGIKKAKKPHPSLPEVVSTSISGRPPCVASASTNSPGSMSYAQQVAILATELSLQTPEWQYVPHPSDPTFHSVSCVFRNGGPHEGPICEVRNIHGKKKAKEECARLTLEYLKEVRERRMEYGKKMMAGISGAEGVIAAAAGRPVEGEREELLAKRLIEKEMDKEVGSDSEVEFEDAMEMAEA